jgi:hypothetical protein
MRRSIIQYVALIALLMQGAFGSVASVAVLCMSHGSCEISIIEGVSPSSCGAQSCCQLHPQEVRAAAWPVIAIASPCDEDCQNCVDIVLPDLTLASVDRVDIQTEDLCPISLPAVMADDRLERFVPPVSPTATGPPEQLACLHAPIIHSTRLLI